MNISFKKLFKNTLLFGIKKITFYVIVFLFIFSTFFFNTTIAATGVPTILHHQGRLLDSTGNLLGGSGTNYCFQFSLYDVPTVGTGTKLWPSGSVNTMVVNVKNGVLNADIGDTSAGGNTLDFDFNSTDEVYLNVGVAAQISGSCSGVTFEDLGPRQRVVSSGYAINAKMVGGYVPSQAPIANQVPVLNGSGNLSLAGTVQSGGLTVGTVSAVTGTMILNNSSNSNTVTIQPGVTSSSYTLTLPTTAGSANQFLQTNGSGVLSWTTIGGGGDALVANPLSQFASTTSAQLAGVISDETGSGGLVFATAPTFDTTITLTTSPTASSGGYEILTRNTTSGVIEKVTSGTFLTANQTITLSGDVTGSGTTGITTTIGADAVALGTDTTGNYVATIADAGSGRITVSGSGSENAGVTLDIADDAVTFAKFQNITDARLLGRSAGSSGDMQELTVGTGLSLSAGVLTSTITQYTNEDAQDAVGGALTSEFTYNDAGNSIAINSINWSKIASTPTTLSGYGITDSVSSTLADGKILIGNGSNIATAVTPTGDVTFSNAGVSAIADNSVDGTDIALGSDAQGDIMYYDGTDWVRLGAGTNGQFLKTQGASANPAWATVASGLTIGSTAIASGTNGRILYDNAGTLGEMTTTGSGTVVALATSPTIGTAVLNNPSIDKVSNLTSNGFVKTSGGDGTLSIDTNTYLTANQTITLSGDVTGSGTTGITTTIGADAVALGTDTTGNYVATIADAGSGRITVSGSGSENAGVTLDIADDAVTFAKFQNITDARLLGRSAGSSGDMQELTVGTGLSLSAGVLTSTITQYTNEDAQDAVGGALTSEFTYNDAGNSIAINSINWSKIASTPTTLSGYGITDSVSSTLADGKILIGNGSNIATAVTPTGDVTFSNAGVATISADAVALGTDTTGNYVASITAGGGLTGTAASEGSTPTIAVVSGNGGIIVNTDDITLTVASSADALSSTTSSGSGMEVLSSGLAMLQGCADNEILKWNETTDVWACSSDANTGVSDGDKGDITVSGSGTTFTIDADVIDFADMADSMTLDAATDINLGANAFTIDMDSTGDFSIRDGSTDIATFTDAGAITFAPTSGQNLNINLGGAGDLAVNTDDLYVDTSTGNVGVGTTSPSFKLHVKDTTTSGVAMFTGLNNSYIYIKGGDAGYDAGIRAQDYDGTRNWTLEGTKTGTTNLSAQGSDFDIKTIANKYLAFSTTNTERMRILGSGNIGIGTTSPSTKLQISGTDTQTSGTGAVGLTITPTYNQASGTAANTDLLINRTQTAVGSGAQNLIDAQVAGSSKFKVTNLGDITATSLTASGYFGIDVTQRINIGTSTNRAIIQASGDGVLKLTDRFETSFDRIQFGGTTSSFPALKRNGTGLDVRLADDSGYGAITASNLSGTNTGDQTITLTGDVTGSGTGSFAATISADSVALTTDTTGNYVASITAGGGLTGTAASEGSTPTIAVVSGNGGIIVNTDDITLTVASSADALSSTTSSGSGMEVLSSGLAMLQGCADNEILKWNETTDVWACSSDANTGVSDGDKGDITVSGSGTTFTIDADSVALGTDTTGNYVATITAGLGITGSSSTEGGTPTIALDQSAALSGDHTLSADTEKFGISGLIFEGSSADTIETYFAITNPTSTDKTITFPDATITVNAAADISGTTLAANVVTSSLTTVGALNAGSITSGFGAIDSRCRQLHYNWCC
jgi:hypothetical protein